jgi:sigma-54 dependent transcriptional regulator, acetoin dehydrogenase operon transcriptional activator AcoR
VVRCRGKEILPSDLPPELTRVTGASPAPARPRSPDSEPGTGKLDSPSVKAALTKTGGNKSKAARLLGVGRATLYRYLANDPDAREFSERF